MKTLIAAVALTLAGCAYGRGATPGTTLTSAPGTPVQLIVTNNSGAPMQVYAVGTGTSWRMGTVLPGLVGHFVLPQAMLGSDAVEFLATRATAIRRSGRAGSCSLRETSWTSRSRLRR